MESYLDGLNEEQLAAVKEVYGRIRCVAGAGSGKTKTLTARYLYLLDYAGVDQEDILAITFTNKAAEEMRSRIGSYIKNASRCHIRTFHGFCHRILSLDGSLINIDSFSIKNNGSVNNLLINCRNRLGLDHDIKAKDLIDKIREIKYSDQDYYAVMTAPDVSVAKKYLNLGGSPEKQIYRQYMYEMKLNNNLDFDDLILLATYLLSTSEPVKKKWQEQLQFILVDEYQDTSNMQQRLLELLAGYHNNIFIVGDPNQTIFEWRGADVESIEQFQADHSFELFQNYRSGQKILDVANELIKHCEVHGCTDLTSATGIDGEVYYYHADGIREEAEVIVDEIKKLHDIGYDYKDIAIIYRNHDSSNKIEDALQEKEIQYDIIRGEKFYDRAEITAALSYLEAVLNPDDDVAIINTINTPSRGIGPAAMRKIDAYIHKQENLGRKLSRFKAIKEMADSGHFSNKVSANIIHYADLITEYHNTYSNYKVSSLLLNVCSDFGLTRYTLGTKEREIPEYEIMEMPSAYESLHHLRKKILDLERISDNTLTLEDYLQQVNLYLDDADKNENRVQLMTIFSAKGTEYDAVFVPQLNENILPSVNAIKQKAIEEERRICYVAFTRAKKFLFLSDSGGFFGNKEEDSLPSRFIIEAGGEEKIKFLKGWNNGLKARMEKAFHLEEGLLTKQGAEFSIGDKVHHKISGDGVITDIKDGKYYIKFCKHSDIIRIRVDWQGLEKITE